MATYRLSKSAENDLFEIWDYTTHAWGKIQAEKYLKKLESRFKKLANEPMKGRLRSDIAINYFSYHEAKHIIFYCKYKSGIAIARVLHERMDLTQQLDDDSGLD